MIYELKNERMSCERTRTSHIHRYSLLSVILCTKTSHECMHLHERIYVSFAFGNIRTDFGASGSSQLYRAYKIVCIVAKCMAIAVAICSI